jgi:bidirectional [NiFe] hydrogenase diaphorase subunit
MIISGLATPWGDSLACTWCGKCVAVCPTGSLSYQGSAVGEMEHSVAMISRLAVARNRGEWINPEPVT